MKLNTLLSQNINKKLRKLKIIVLSRRHNLYFCDCDKPVIRSRLRGWIVSCKVITRLMAVVPGVFGMLEPNWHSFFAYKL